MAANIEASLIEKVRGLSLNKQQEVLEFVERLDQREVSHAIRTEPKDRMLMRISLPLTVNLRHFDFVKLRYEFVTKFG